MRVPFYCGIVSAASVKILDWIPGTSTNTILLICVIPVGLFLPFGPLLLIPAIQLRSLKVAVKALLLSLVLLVGDIILSSFFSIDNRILSGLPLIVPGGLNQMNPGGPIEYLFPNLAIFIAITTLALARTYKNTRILGCPYWARILIGVPVLMVILNMEIDLTTVTWSDVATNSAQHLLKTWPVASTSWLCALGVFWAFIFGVCPDKVEPAIEESPSVRIQADTPLPL